MGTRLFPVTIVCLGNFKNCFYCGKIHIKFTILAIFPYTVSGIKYIQIVIQPLPPSVPIIHLVKLKLYTH